MDKKSSDVVVVGGGLAGLTAAAFVAQAGLSVTVLERQALAGGRARTDRKDGYWLNQGPHALYASGAGVGVLAELGVVPHGGAPNVAGSVTFSGEHGGLPATAGSLIKSKAFSVRDKVEIGKVITKIPKIDVSGLATVTVDEWVASMVSRERPTLLMHALIRLATYAHASGELSADVAVLQLQLALESGVLYLDHGWQTLVDGLLAHPGVTVETGTTVNEVPDARAVIIAGTPELASTLLGTQFDVGPAAVAHCIDMGLARQPERSFVLGGDVPYYSSDHSAVAQLAPDGQWHVAAAEYLEPGGVPDEAGLRSFIELTGIDNADIVLERRLPKMTVVSAIATASRGGLAGRPATEQPTAEGVYLAGDWVGPTGHMADAAIASGKSAALAALRRVRQRSSV